MIFVTGGKANVCWPQGGAKGVGGGVDTALGKIKTERFRDLAIKGLLGFNGRGTVEKVCGNGERGFYCGSGNLREFASDGVE